MSSVRRPVIGRIGTMIALWLLMVAAFAQAATPGSAAPGFSELGGLVPLSEGYQRLPASDATYMDTSQRNRVDPRLNPWNPAHVQAAARAALRPSASQRQMTDYAYLLGVRGDAIDAAAALARTKERYPNAIGVFWSEGWIRIYMDDYEGALVAWQAAERLHGGQPAWVPYSKAIALIGAGDVEAAKAWWQVAVRGLAPRLDSAEQARRTFSNWKGKERDLLERLLAVAY